MGIISPTIKTSGHEEASGPPGPIGTGKPARVYYSRFVASHTESDPRCFGRTIRIRLGHESLDVTIAYLKGKDAESEEAQEHANSSSLALYA